MSRFLIAFVVVGFSCAAHPVVRTWPGIAPCDTTLSACLTGAIPNDTVQVATNSPINESPSINKPLTLVAAQGYTPVFAAGNFISAYYAPSVNTPWRIDIEGFTLPDGYARITQGAGTGTLVFKHMNVSTLSSVSNSGITVLNVDATQQAYYEIADNIVTVSSSEQQCAVCILPNNTSATMVGSAHDNRISLLGNATGIFVEIDGANASTQIYSNQIRGQTANAITLFAQSASAETAIVLSNAVSCAGSSGTGLLINVAAALQAHIMNNTFDRCATGVNIFGAGVSGEFENNIVTNNSTDGIYISSTTAPITNDRNLFFNNPHNRFVPGPNTITADPQYVHAPDNLRLTAISPAIDAANSLALSSLLGSASVPEIDADGSRRFKGAASAVDIGAFEYGDVAVSRVVDGTGSISSPALDGHPELLPQLMQNFRPDTYDSYASDAALTALTFANGKFAVVEEATGGAPTLLSGYMVFAPSPGAGAFEHITAMSNVSGSSTLLDDPSVDAHPDRIVLATHRAMPLFDHPFGLRYASGWIIQQLDTGNIATGVHFDIYAQDPSLNAFVWKVPAASGWATLDHPLLNGEPCGHVYVSNGTSNAHPVAVTYQQERWQIVNVDGASIPANAQFNVVVDEAATQFCRYDHIFHDGVEVSQSSTVEAPSGAHAF